MLYKPSKTLTFVIYEDQKPAKCFEINKGQLKFLSLFIPFLVLALIFTSLFIYSSYRVLTMQVDHGPWALVDKLQKDQLHLIKGNKGLKEQNDYLKEKIQLKTSVKFNDHGKKTSPTMATSATNLSLFSLFAPTSEKIVTSPDSSLNIKNIKFHSTPQNLEVIFDLINTSSDEHKTTISGHFFILLSDGSQISIFPQIPLDIQGPSLTQFDRGESFTVTRFRPVMAKFPKSLLSKNSLFKVLIFSKKGDLILQKTFSTTGL